MPDSQRLYRPSYGLYNLWSMQRAKHLCRKWHTRDDDPRCKLSLKADVSTFTLQRRAQTAGLLLDLNTRRALLITATLHPSVNNAITFDRNIFPLQNFMGPTENTGLENEGPNSPESSVTHSTLCYWDSISVRLSVSNAGVL